MLEFLAAELALSGEAMTVHLGGFLAELAPEPNGSSADTGGVEQFVDAALKVKASSNASARRDAHAPDA